MGAVWELCEFSLLISQQNHSDLSLTALDNAQKQFYRKKRNFREQKMSKSVMVKVDKQFRRKCVLQWKFRHMGLNRFLQQN